MKTQLIIAGALALMASGFWMRQPSRPPRACCSSRWSSSAGLLNDWGVDPDLALIFFGAALLRAVMTAPEGLAGQIAALIRRPA